MLPIMVRSLLLLGAQAFSLPMRPDFSPLIARIRAAFPAADGEVIPLHAPRFLGREREYVLECLDSTFVSSVGPFVDRVEADLARVTGAAHAVACVNGTSALQTALLVSGVEPGDLVLTQALTFVATANAIRHAGADPVFLDVCPRTLGLDPEAVHAFVSRDCDRSSDGALIHRNSGRRVSACVPMHTFGLCADIHAIARVCERSGLTVVEDAAESLGSSIEGAHTGTVGRLGVLSFNGNKVITAGGGGAILTDDPELARRAKHLTTQAKVSHRWEFQHDEIGFNHRMPNLNAALLCAQLEQLDEIVTRKRTLAAKYMRLLADSPLEFVSEPPGQRSNYWLCAARLADVEHRDAFLTQANDAGVQARPAWAPLTSLPMYRDALVPAPVTTTEEQYARLVSLPSSPHHFDRASGSTGHD